MEARGLKLWVVLGLLSAAAACGKAAQCELGQSCCEGASDCPSGDVCVAHSMDFSYIVLSPGGTPGACQATVGAPCVRGFQCPGGFGCAGGAAGPGVYLELQDAGFVLVPGSDAGVGCQPVP